MCEAVSSSTSHAQWGKYTLDVFALPNLGLDRDDYIFIT